VFVIHWQGISVKFGWALRIFISLLGTPFMALFLMHAVLVLLNSYGPRNFWWLFVSEVKNFLSSPRN
jgi:hypothetical protein